jgi:hypothetical protein
MIQASVGKMPSVLQSCLKRIGTVAILFSPTRTAGSRFGCKQATQDAAAIDA